jgi:large subunit ribosomal protein L10
MRQTDVGAVDATVSGKRSRKGPPDGARQRRRNVDRSQKEKQVEELRGIFDGAELMVLTHQTGLTVAESTDLRTKMRESGARFKVTKNRLARLAIQGTKFAELADQFKGPTAIAYSEDPVAAAKVAVNFAKDNDKLVVIGGALNDKVLETSEIDALAKLPSLDQLRGKLVGLLQAPATKVAGVLQAPAGQLARVFSAYGSKDAA